MNVLIIEDSLLWIIQGRTLLEQAGHEVNGFFVHDPKEFTSASLPEDLVNALQGVDVVIIDAYFSKEIGSTKLICVIRHHFPDLPIIRWDFESDDNRFIRYLGVTHILKPVRKDEANFAKVFDQAVEEQRLILSGPTGIFAAVGKNIKNSQDILGQRKEDLENLQKISQLARCDQVDSGLWVYPWTINENAKSTDFTRHTLGHCICDGLLTAEDIHPLLPDLQKVIEKFEAAGKVDERFKICADFLKAGNLAELELVRNCY